MCVRLCGEDHVYALELTCGCLFAGRGPGGTRNLHQICGPWRGSCPGKLSVFAYRCHVSHVSLPLSEQSCLLATIRVVMFVGLCHVCHVGLLQSDE